MSPASARRVSTSRSWRTLVQVSASPSTRCEQLKKFIRAGLAGCHIEDQLFPKRAFYHKYVVHTISRDEYLAKLRFACRERDAIDKDFLVIARTDALRGEGFDEAITRLNLAADTGVNMGLLFPRSREEAERAPRLARLPLVYVQSRGNRDGRPLFTTAEMKQIGYTPKSCSLPHFTI